MKLWGWLGPDHADLVDASPGVAPWLASQVGLTGLMPTPPAELDLASVPPSRLDPAMRAALTSAIPAARLSDDARDRVPLSLGQSYPDQLARRAGSIGFVADLVASPETTDEVVGLLGAAAAAGFRVMPVGGATSVVGGLVMPSDDRPVVVADMRRMNRVLGQGTGTVTAQAGIGLAALERELGAAGRTLGHFPQSFEAATLGGSIMANGSGQRSDAYGRIGDMLVSARLATPGGLWSTESFRHAAGGPWLGGLVSGSEGLFGILTDATLRTRPKPEHVEDRAWLLPSLSSAIDAVRLIKESGAHLAMVRVSDAAETAFLSGFRLARRGLERPPLLERLVLSAKGAPPDPLLVVAGYEGAAVGAKAAFAQAGDVLGAAGGVALGPVPGASWRKSRFEAPHLRESIMARGLGVDTFETAAPWDRLEALHSGLCNALRTTIGKTLDGGAGRPVVFAHISHSYAEGACIYATAIFPRAPDALAQWRAIKTAATDAIMAGGGALSHHHGVGADHAPWLEDEKGAIGLRIMSAIRHELDPHRVLATGMSDFDK
jgi:alkyldihydroxyacetonephosphate synthase